MVAGLKFDISIWRRCGKCPPQKKKKKRLLQKWHVHFWRLNFRPMVEEYDLFVLKKSIFVETLLLIHYCVIVGLKTCIETTSFYLILFVCNFLKNSRSPVHELHAKKFYNGAALLRRNLTAEEKLHFCSFYFFYYLKIYFFTVIN